MANLNFPYMANLNFPDLSQLIKDPIAHDPSWLVIPTKLPSHIPKFEGKVEKNPSNHILSFPLYFSSNSIIEYSVHLCLF